MAGLTPAPLPTPDTKARAVEAMFDRIAPRYDRLNRILTLGLDVGWRRRAVASLALPRGARVLDLACGTGDLCRELSRAGYRSAGVDYAAGMLAHNRSGAPLIRADILALPVAAGAVDGAVCGFALRNVVDIAGCLAEMARVVRCDGRIAVLEVGEPHRALLRRGHALYLHRVVPVIGGLLADRAAYRYLPASTSYLPPAGELEAMVAKAGFSDARRLSLGAGAAQLLLGTRR